MSFRSVEVRWESCSGWRHVTKKRLSGLWKECTTGLGVSVQKRRIQKKVHICTNLRACELFLVEVKSEGMGIGFGLEI